MTRETYTVRGGLAPRLALATLRAPVLGLCCMREITHRYEDPLSRVWTSCAERMGFRVVRDPGAYASTDGRGTILIATDEHLDPDDSLAQMIFHELCHSLVQGPDSLTKVDWGLDNVGPDDVVREHACLRLQALLTRPLGLGRLFAPTTDFRAFWDTIGPDPLAPESDPSVPLARRAAARMTRPPWGPHLELALQVTASIAESAGMFGESRTARDSLWSLVDPRRPLHPTGLVSAAPDTRAASERCGTCAFAGKHGNGLRCHKARVGVRAELAACERWEDTLDCQRCGACCREAFDTVLVGKRDPFVRRHPHLVVVKDGAYEMPRPTGSCASLGGEGSEAEPYACQVYEDRPRTCRDFRRGSPNCLLARERVGLSW